MISSKHECIFVHVPKTGGQSVEHMFLHELGLSWRQRAPLLLAHNTDRSKGPRKLAHLTAEEYVSCGHVSQEDYDRYYRFAFVRDPWDRAVSFYKYLPVSSSFADFVHGTLREGQQTRMRWFIRPQVDFVYGADGKLLVDHVARFENFGAEVNAIRARLGIKAPLEHRNKSAFDLGETLQQGASLAKAVLTLNRKAFARAIRPFQAIGKVHHKTTAEYYTPETWDAVGDIYRADIDAFGYGARRDLKAFQRDIG